MNTKNSARVWATREDGCDRIILWTRAGPKGKPYKFFRRTHSTMSIRVADFEKIAGFTIAEGDKKRLSITFGRGKTIYVTRNRDATWCNVWYKRPPSASPGFYTDIFYNYACNMCIVEFHHTFPGRTIRAGTCVRLRVKVEIV